MTPPRSVYIDELESTYVDDGCELAPRCLECPFPRCRYDFPSGGGGGGVRAMAHRHAERDVAVIAALDAGEHSEDVAARFGVSRRTVFRIKAASHPWGTDTIG